MTTQIQVPEDESEYNVIEEWLDSLTDSRLIELHRIFCDHHHYDSNIFINDDDFIPSMFTDVKKAVMATYESYNPSHSYASVTSNGKVYTYDSVKNHIDMEELAKDIANNDWLYGIEVIIQEEEEEEDEE